MVQFIRRIDVQQMVQESGVPQKYLWRLRQTFPDVAEVRRQPVDQELLFEDIEISLHQATSGLHTRVTSMQ
jgi:hypothetical protein